MTTQIDSPKKSTFSVRGLTKRSANSTYDLLVVGGELAISIAEEGVRLGARVALAIDHPLHGGTDPGAQVRRAMIQIGQRGCQAARDVFNLWAAQTRETDLSAQWQSAVERLRGRAIVIEGHAVFTGRHSCAIHGREVRFAKAILAPASIVQAPAIPGLEKTPCFTSQDWHLMGDVPHRIAVLGAGPAACEFAQALVRAGAEVHLVTNGSPLLPEFDRDAVSLLEAELLREGVRLHHQSPCVAVESIGKMKALTLSGDEGRRKVFVDELLVAGEYAPTVDRMALPAAGVTTVDGRIQTNGHLRTSNPRVFAINDALVHPGNAPRVAAASARNALLSGRLPLEGDLSARCVMTQPQIAMAGAGSSHADARPGVETYRASEHDVTGADIAGEQHLAIVAARAVDGRIAGATLAGNNAADLMVTVLLAMKRKQSLRNLAALPVPDSLGARVMQQAGRIYADHRRSGASPARRWLWQRQSA